MTLLRTLFLLATLALAAAPAARAGNWTELPRADDDFWGCNFRFEGEIRPGDLVAILDVPAWRDTLRRRVCLDSPGGNLGEVYAFLRRSENPGTDFGTAIESGDTCASACAILFMFGQSWGANSPMPDRVIAPGGRLGFHSPFLLDRARGMVSDQAYRAALDTSRLLVDRAYKATTQSGAPLPVEMLTLVLATPSDEIHFVDTVGEARILNIELSTDPERGIVIPNDTGAVAALARRICASTYALTFRQHLVETGYAFADLVAFVEETLADEERAHVDHLAYRPLDNDWSGAPGEVFAFVTGNRFYVPGWYSAGSGLYCRVGLKVEPRDDGLLVKGYGADFDLLSKVGWDDLDYPAIPDRTGAYDEMVGGLVPIDMPIASIRPR